MSKQKVIAETRREQEDLKQALGDKDQRNSLSYRTYFPGDSDGKASASNVGDSGLIPGSGRSPGEGNGNPLQHSCLENPMDGGA